MRLMLALPGAAGRRHLLSAAALWAGAMLALAPPAWGAVPDLTGGGAAPAAAETPTAEPAITAEREIGQDAQIRERITGIFAAIDALAGVNVAVEQGVVSLSGSAARAEDVAEAESIARRVAGVVTVRNDIERDVAVDRNLGPTVDGIVREARALLRMVPLLLVALVVAVLAALLFYALARARSLWQRLAPNNFLAELVASALRFVGVLFGIYLALKILGATALLGALLGVGGVIGIAIGFAIRDTIDNYISSVMLSVRQPFRANDHVVIDGDEGRVVRLTSRATVLMTLDGNHLRIPNGTVFKAVILNYTTNPERRFDFDLGIDADDDPVEGMRVGIAALRALPYVLDEPEPSAWVCDVGDSNIRLRFFGWVDQRAADFFKARSLSIQACKVALESAGFALPEPIYRLRIDPRTAPILTALAHPAEKAGSAAGTRSRAAVPAPGSASAPNDKRVVEQAQRAKPSARSAATTTEAHDIRPDDHIAELVHRERALTGEKDLLDGQRPTE